MTDLETMHEEIRRIREDTNADRDVRESLQSIERALAEREGLRVTETSSPARTASFGETRKPSATRTMTPASSASAGAPASSVPRPATALDPSMVVGVP